MKGEYQSISTGSSLKRGNPVAVIFILGVLSAFGPLSLDMYLPALPTLARELHTSASLAQVSLTACLLGLAFGQVVMGPFSDMSGRRRPLIVALIVYGIVSFLCIFTSSIWAFVALRFVQGVAGATGIVISRASVRDLFSGKELTKFYAMIMLVNGVAPILAPVAGGQLLHFVSWRGVFGALAVIGVLMFLAVLVGLKETLPIEARKTGGLKEVWRTFGLLLKDREFMGYALMQGFVMGGMFAYISGSTFVLQDIYGLSAQMFSVIFAINGVGIILATQTTGRLAGKMNAQSLLAYGITQAVTSSVLLLVTILFHAPVIFICIFLFFFVSSIGIINTMVFSLAMENQGSHAGSASALLGLLPFLLGSIVAPLVGIGNGKTAVPMGVVITCCAFIALGAYIFLVRRNRR